MIHHSDLCVGGPHDGKRFHHDAPTFRAPILPPLSAMPLDTTAPHTTVSEVIYRRMLWHVNDTDVVTLWAPEGAAMLDVLQRLLEVYEIGASFAGKPPEAKP